MADLKKELEARHREILEFLHKGEVDEYLNCYTEDVINMAAGAELSRGREALKSYHAANEFNNDATGDHSTVVVEAFLNGDQVTTVQLTTIYGKGGEVVYKAKSVLVWKKVDDVWKIRLLCWNATDILQDD